MTTLFYFLRQPRRCTPLQLRVLSIFVVTFLCLSIFSDTVSATNIYVISDGEQTATILGAEDASIASLLAQAGIQADGNDVGLFQSEDGVAQIVVYHTSEEAVPVETPIALWEEVPAVTTVRTSTHAVPCGTEIRKTDTLPLGETQILTVGHDGLRTLREQITWGEDGIELSRTVLSSTLTVAPVNQVILEGTAEPIPENAIVTQAGEVLTYSAVLSCEATAYTCEGQSWNTTATGTTARVGEIAVDPSVIPLGSRLYISSDDGYCIYGVCTAEDTGGAIRGNRIDLYFDTYTECICFGRRQCTVYILE